MTFLHGYVTDKVKIKKVARLEIKRAKLQYKDKTEAKFYSNNLKAVWDGMRTMTDQKNRGNKPISIGSFNSYSADELNGFYLRFNDSPNSNFGN